MGSHRRVWLQSAADMAAWLIAVPLAYWLRFDFTAPSYAWTTALMWGGAAAIAQVLVGYGLRLYRGRYKIGSFDEVSGVVQTVMLVTVFWLGLVLLATPPETPRTIPVTAGIIALSGMLAGRFLLRFLRERILVRPRGDKTLVYGAGEGGQQLLRAMQGPDSGYWVVGLLDDDPRKQRLRLSGVPVRGTIVDLERVAHDNRANVLVVAFASVTAKQLLSLDKRCRVIGVQLRVIPSPVDIVRGAVRLSDVSDVTEEDLLGRQPVCTQENSIAEMLHNKRVLITGAGGSIGSELARQVHSYGPSYLGLLDRDESALHALHLTMFGRAMQDTDDLLLADIRDLDRLREIVQCVQPDIVFHAAALKHLPMLEAAPAEAYKTNVIGSHNVLLAARENNVPVFINISTDKAADPVSVLGYSKRTTERLTAGIVPPAQGRYLSVRFGNVLGSRGSMLASFRAQIAAGGPVTVTHPEVTRYFMTIPEAVHLVLQAATIGRDSETLILDMGEPVRILDVATHMVEKSGRDIEIEITGLRDGEKLHEVLSSEAELGERPLHPLITHVNVSPLPLSAVDMHATDSDEVCRLTMKRMAMEDISSRMAQSLRS